MTDREEENQALMREQTQQIGALNQQVNERDTWIKVHLKQIEKHEARVLRLSCIITEVAESSIEYTSGGRYHCVQISCALWDVVTGMK